MNRAGRTRSCLLALLLAAPTARGAEPETAALDQTLCRVDSILRLFAEDAAPSEASCPAFRIEDLPAYVAASSGSVNLPSLGNDAVAYGQYGALAGGGDSSCDFLRPLQAAADESAGRPVQIGGAWAESCRAHYRSMLFHRAIYSGNATLERLCLEVLADGPVVKDPRERARICRSLADDPRRAEDLCVQVRKASPLLQNRCRAELGALLSGDAARCLGVDDEKRLECLGFAAFGKAYASGDPSFCRGNDECSAMAGRPARIAGRYRRALIADAAPALLATASAGLDAAASSTDTVDEAWSVAVSSRAERVAALRAIYDPSAPSSPEKFRLCLREVSPEDILSRRFGAVSDNGLLAYAECMAIAARDTSPCDYLPGGSIDRAFPPDGAGTASPGRAGEACAAYSSAFIAGRGRGNAASCLPGDAFCRALLEGKAACGETGRRAVEAFCRERYPETKAAPLRPAAHPE